MSIDDSYNRSYIAITMIYWLPWLFKMSDLSTYYSFSFRFGEVNANFQAIMDSRHINNLFTVSSFFAVKYLWPVVMSEHSRGVGMSSCTYPLG